MYIFRLNAHYKLLMYNFPVFLYITLLPKGKISKIYTRPKAL